MMDRRSFLAGAAGVGALPGMAAAATRDNAMRGSFGPEGVDLVAASLDQQSRIFARMLEKASAEGLPLDLPAGDYPIANILLPRRIVIRGVPGATRLIFSGNGHFIMAESAEQVVLQGLVLDGANRSIHEQAEALVHLRGVSQLTIDDCQFVGSTRHALMLEACAGRVERSRISGAADVGIFAVGSRGLEISSNSVLDCGNGGILVHRWQPGEDGTIVRGNRIERILALAGGTGPHGNGINVFRAGNVMIADNAISDCAFSAIRANSAGNVQIRGNTCLRSGETAIYSEFAFEGAVISDNIVDGAANGISIVNFNEGGRLAVCSGNLVRNLSTKGPYPGDAPGFGVGITVEADTAVTGNVVENAPVYGMHIGWGPFLRNVTATGNIVRKVGTGIAVTVVEGSGRALISGNVIDDAADGGIVGYRWTERATGDLGREGSADIAHLTVERNSVG